MNNQKSQNKREIISYISIIFLVIYLLLFASFLIWSGIKNINNPKLNRNFIDWVSWAALVFSSYFSIFFTIFFYLRIYNKENINIFTIKKITIFSLFFSIFMIQAFITRIMPEIGDLIPFSLDSITVMTIGFLFGPIEAIIFGFAADFARTLINGWTYQILAGSIFPIIGMISGIFGRKFQKINSDLNINNLNEDFIKTKKIDKTILSNKIFNIFIFHTILFLFLVLNIYAIKYSLNNNKNIEINFIIISTSILIFFVESIYFYIFFKKSEDLNLILLILVSVVLSRAVTGFLIRPFSMYFYYGLPFKSEIIKRVVTSSYLIPSKIIVLYFVLKASINSINLIYN